MKWALHLREHSIQSCFFNRIPSTSLESPVRSHLQVLWASLWLRDRRGRREVYGSEEIWRGAHARLSVKWRGERASSYTCQAHEQSTSVHPLLLRQMSPSENRAFWKHSTLISAYLCLTVFHRHMSTNTLIHTQTKGKWCKMCSMQQYLNTNILCLQRYRICPVVRRTSSFLPDCSMSMFTTHARL